MVRDSSDNLSDFDTVSNKNCLVCKNLLVYLERFLDVLATSGRSFTSDWLTVDEIADELKISKSIVYRHIRNGELEAVDLVDANGKIALKGHYRVTRSSLNQFLESRKIRPLPKQISNPCHSRRLPKVKNHLGL